MFTIPGYVALRKFFSKVHCLPRHRIARYTCTVCVTGVYNYNFVSGIETIVNWCRAHGVKVMFTFLDNWSPVDSISAVR